jgi:cytoskeletal protein CcmA (bactofilin family)
MFTNKSKNEAAPEKEKTNGNGATLIGAGTIVKGDIHSDHDIRIDGRVEGNITGSSKVIVGANGAVEGNISGRQADVLGKVNGNIKVSDILQLKGASIVNGNVYAAKLHVEPSATFNGECHMGANIVEMKELNESVQPVVAVS